MANLWLIFLAFLGTAHAFEKMDPKYQIQYGDPASDLQIVEYFSLSCPKCFDFFIEDFPVIKEKYLNTKKISWSFHPDPADLLTLQALVCLEKLDEKQKPIFFEAIVKNLIQTKFKHGCLLMQGAMEVFDCPIPKLDKIEFLSETTAFKEAFKFLKQDDVVKMIPTLEVNGKIHSEYPTAELVGKLIQNNKRAS